MFTSVLCVISPREFCQSLTLKGFEKEKEKKKATDRSKGYFTENKGSHKTGIPGDMKMLEPAGACLYCPRFSIF